MRRVRLIVLAAAALAPLSLAACGQGGGQPTVIEQQVAHPNGVVLQVLSARAGSDLAEVSLRIINGRDRAVELNRGQERTFLITGSGERLPLVPAPTNASLNIPAGQMIEAVLVFQGALPRGEAVTLVVNENGQADNPHAASPRFESRFSLDGGFGARGIGEASSLSGMRPVPASTLQIGAASGSSLAAGERSASALQAIEALKTELGARESERGAVVSLAGDVTFDFDQATIRQAPRPTLDRLAELVRLQEGVTAIEGHTDGVGEDAYNQRLSEQRAQAVKDYLISRGVPAERLSAAGFGKTRPVAPNTRPDGADDEEARSRNRRVEVILPADPAAADGPARSTLSPAP